MAAVTDGIVATVGAGEARREHGSALLAGPCGVLSARGEAA